MESSYCLAIADVPNPGALVSWHSKGPRGYCKEKKKMFFRLLWFLEGIPVTYLCDLLGSSLANHISA